MMAPRLAVCVLGSWPSLTPVERVVRSVGGAGFGLVHGHSRCEPDAGMTRAFELAADRVKPTLRREDREAISRHRAVAYVISPPLVSDEAQRLAARMLAVIAALLDSGASAAKADSSGLAHGAAQWRQLAARAASATRAGHLPQLAEALLQAWVRRPLREVRDEPWLYTCGLHLLGARDLEIAEGKSLSEDLAWLDLLALYLLVEPRATMLRRGEPFRMRPGGEARMLDVAPCERFGDADLAFNPYDYWRLLRPE